MLPAARRLDGRHWSGRSEGLKGMADAVGLGPDYAVQYRLHSGSVHANRPWDQILFDPAGPLVVPALDEHKPMGLSLALDALRYVAWLLSIAHTSGAVPLYASEQNEVNSYSKYLEPLDALFQKGIVGAG